jgi:hypothetical protein
MESEVQWTTAYMEDLNQRLAEAGLPQLIVEDHMVYKDELHKLLGIGVRLDQDEEG